MFTYAYRQCSTFYSFYRPLLPLLPHMFFFLTFIICFHTQNGESCLLQACYKGHLQAAQLMIKNKADLNVQEKVQ